MRRSICFCAPSQALAGEIQTWKFVFTTANALPKGTLLKFDLNSEGRSIDWQVPDINLKNKSNVIYAMLDNGKVLSAKVIELENRFTPQYEFILTEEIDVGESFTVVVGAPEGIETTEATGNMAQCTTQRRRNFQLYLDPSGKGRYDEPEVFTMDIKGSALKNIRVLVPSFVVKNKRFDILVRFEDEFGNLTSNTDDDTLIELYYENLRENLNWKLFIPETGFITLPNLYFNEPGVYTIHLKNAKTGEIFKGPPIQCFADYDQQLLWGQVHGESERIDSAENIESCLRHFRDEKAYQFYAISPFESTEETPPELWKLNTQNVVEFEEAERFSTFLGFQWAGVPGVEGLRQIVFSKDNKTIIRKKEPKGASLKKLYKNFSPKELIAIPSFTMADGTQFNFENFNPEFERVVEIYNAWGSSERTEKEGNPRPIKTLGKTGVKEVAEGSVVDALKKNMRFGFVAGGLDDRGVYADFFDSEQVQYSPGLTGVIAPEHSRNAIFEALYRRSCYATTGERMVVNFFIAGTPMGGEASTADKPGLIVNRHIAGYVAGTGDLESVEIVRNGEVIKVINPENSYHVSFTFDDMQDLLKVLLSYEDKGPSFAFYYIRATQKDGHMAWSSPIWIDYAPDAVSDKKLKRPARPPRNTDFSVGFDDADEEEDQDYDEDDVE